MKSIVKFIFFSVLVSLISGCHKYLDVHPKSSVAEEQMFEDEIGFQQALTGVYSFMAKANLYGDRLSFGFVSALSQDYGQSASTAPYIETKNLNYTSAEVKGHLSAIWSGAYTALATVNKVIINTEERRFILNNESYSRIRGEALALRAYLHFDLLRLFGPEYSTGKDQKAIPYRITVEPYGTPPSTTKEVVEKILADLEEASALLEKVDPITAATTAATAAPRRIYMNYFATKGLEARVKLYIGDRGGAYSAAKTVVNAANRFPFVTATSAGASASSRDRLYVNELIFGLRTEDITSIVDGYFRFSMGASYKLTREATQIDQIYEGNTKDIRRQYRFEASESVLFPSKFWQTFVPLADQGQTPASRTDRFIPMIRLSEMYYILSETSETSGEGVSYLNKVRLARALPELIATGLTDIALQQEIEKEYRKEFYGEGQLFYFYKRKSTLRMQFMSTDMSLAKYKLPIPDEELEYNPTY